MLGPIWLRIVTMKSIWVKSVSSSPGPPHIFMANNNELLLFVQMIQSLDFHVTKFSKIIISVSGECLPGVTYLKGSFYVSCFE